MKIRLMAAASAVALFVLPAANAHPGGLHTWPLYHKAKLPSMWRNPPDPEHPAAAAWLVLRADAVKDLRADWRDFDARYWASLEPEPGSEPSSGIPVTAFQEQTPSGSVDWYAIAQCESGGNWSINTGNGYYGGLQFSQSTWLGYGGSDWSWSGPFPFSAAEQIAVAERVLDGQGIGAWPHCGAYG